MLLQKTLHMSQPVAECKARLASIQSYRRQFLMVTRATVTSSKTVDFSFRGPLGFEAHTVLLSVESDSPDEYAFESVGGNITLMGIVDFAEIRPNCTEVTLAVHYEIKNQAVRLAGSALAFRGQFCHGRTAQYSCALRRNRSQLPRAFARSAHVPDGYCLTKRTEEPRRRRSSSSTCPRISGLAPRVFCPGEESDPA